MVRWRDKETAGQSERRRKGDQGDQVQEKGHARRQRVEDENGGLGAKMGILPRNTDRITSPQNSILSGNGEETASKEQTAQAEFETTIPEQVGDRPDLGFMLTDRVASKVHSQIEQMMFF